MFDIQHHVLTTCPLAFTTTLYNCTAVQLDCAMLYSIMSSSACTGHFAVPVIWLGEVYCVEIFSEWGSISIPWLVVIDPLRRPEGSKPRRPYVVDWISWVNNSRMTQKQMWIVSTLAQFFLYSRCCMYIGYNYK